MKINGYDIALSEDDLTHKIENETIEINLIDSDFSGYKELSEGNKKAFHHLINAAKMFNDIFLEQDHQMNLAQKEALEEKASTSSHAAKALEFFNLYNGIEGLNGIDKKPIELFTGLTGVPGRNFYPEDLSVEELQNILIDMLNAGEIDEVKKILSVRTMVRHHGNKLKAIDYTEYFAKEFSEIANQIELAAHYTDDEALKDYLGWQAQALLQNNDDMDMLADKHWAVLQDCPIEFTIGRENYADELTGTVFNNPTLSVLLDQHKIEVNAKDALGVRVGIVNKEGTDLILRFKDNLPKLAELMPLKDQYTQSFKSGEEVKQTMVDVDLAALTGDYAAARGGLTIAQNLPNNDKTAVRTGGGRRNVYHRQVRQTTDDERAKKILDLLVQPQFHKYYNPEAEHLFVIGHENGHSLGPDSSFQSALGSFKHIIEEHKADVISLTMMPHCADMGIIDKETLKEIYLTHVVSGFFLKAEPNLSLPHRVGDLMQFNYALQHSAISFDDNGKLAIDFDRFAGVMSQLLEETIAIQLSKSPEKAKAFVDKYAAWGEHSRRIADIQAQLGIKPYKRIKMHF